ncbi:MAG: RnfABCDGE type electron transport complex subunit B [Candidatus Latescibacteria bacterium]|nr:RnfABCDGE type electron transport complex subunit B [Candidatus Latescibacterota bacterium]
MSVFFKSIITLGGLGLCLGVALAFIFKKLAVAGSELEKQIKAALPGSNCGACGFPGCAVYAEKIVKENLPINKCLPGGKEVLEKLGKIMGKDLDALEHKIAALICRGGKDECRERFIYDGGTDCRQAYLMHGGNKSCVFGCVGLGHCASVCPFGAIKMNKNRQPVINDKKCTACGICVKQCPKDVLVLIPRTKLVYLACVSQDKGKAVKDVCTVGCFTCNICIRACPYNALTMKGNLPVMDFNKCTDCGICVHRCPTDSYLDRAKARPYAFISSACTGCGECVKVCQFKAIEGSPEQRHKGIIAKCIGCGECFNACPVRAITMAGALGHQTRTA